MKAVLYYFCISALALFILLFGWDLYQSQAPSYDYEYTSPFARIGLIGFCVLLLTLAVLQRQRKNYHWLNILFYGLIVVALIVVVAGYLKWRATGFDH